MFVLCDVLASVFGFVGSVSLLVSAWRGMPFKKVLDLSKTLRSGPVLASQLEKDVRNAETQLSEVLLIEPLFIRFGAACLAIGFLLSIVKYAFE